MVGQSTAVMVARHCANNQGRCTVNNGVACASQIPINAPPLNQQIGNQATTLVSHNTFQRPERHRQFVIHCT